jgi:electron transfer flavoprotein alpha subunit
MKTNEVWVYIEQHNGKIADVSLELLGKARFLAEQLQVKVGAVLPGSDIKALTETLFTYGADKAYLADNKALKDYTTLPYAKVVVDLIKKYQPQIVLYGATTTGRDVAPRIASELRVGLTTDWRLYYARHRIS